MNTDKPLSEISRLKKKFLRLKRQFHFRGCATCQKRLAEHMARHKAAAVAKVGSAVAVESGEGSTFVSKAKVIVAKAGGAHDIDALLSAFSGGGKAH